VLTGRSRATRYSRPKPARPAPIRQAEWKAPTQALSPAECAQVLKVINSEAYAALSIGQVGICKLDEDRYWCSLSSMYRIARRAGQTRAIRPGPHGTYAGSHERQKRRLPRSTT